MMIMDVAVSCWKTAWENAIPKNGSNCKASMNRESASSTRGTDTKGCSWKLMFHENTNHPIPEKQISQISLISSFGWCLGPPFISKISAFRCPECGCSCSLAAGLVDRQSGKNAKISKIRGAEIQHPVLLYHHLPPSFLKPEV